MHRIVSDSVAAGARPLTGRTDDRLVHRPTVLAEVPLHARSTPTDPRARGSRRQFPDLEGAVRLAAGTGFGLSLGVITFDVMAGLELASRVPVGIVHINDQAVTDEPVAPFGGTGLSGKGPASVASGPTRTRSASRSG